MLPILMIVLDGVGDAPAEEFNHKTPLEVASKPGLDSLAKKGAMGLTYTVAKGIAPESDAGVLSLLGYDPLSIHVARGVVEALGAGLPFEDGDLALRCGFATRSGDVIIDRRAGRDITAEEAGLLEEAIERQVQLNSGVDFRFKATVGHRAVVIFKRGKVRFSGAISNLDPAYERVGGITVAKAMAGPLKVPRCEALEDTPESHQTARLVNEFAEKAHRVLESHEVNLRRSREGRLPANFLLLRDAGVSTPKVPRFEDRFGLRGAMVADLPVELGIAKLLGLSAVALKPERTLEGYRSRAEEALKLLKEYDFVYVHLKGPDEPGHDGDFKEKVRSIEKIDEGFFSPLLEGLDLKGSIVCITSDHSTPCKARAHTDDPAPTLLLGKGIASDGLKAFTEAEAARGSLGLLERGSLLLPLLKDRALRGEQ